MLQTDGQTYVRMYGQRDMTFEILFQYKNSANYTDMDRSFNLRLRQPKVFAKALAEGLLVAILTIFHVQNYSLVSFVI